LETAEPPPNASSDHTRSVRAKQLDEGSVDTLV
jgi:hypothetical protein